MKRKKNSSDFESIRREIARRLHAGLPLAGMIAATSLLCGCQERAGRVPEGLVERDPSLYERQESEKQKQEEQYREIKKYLDDHHNSINESQEVRTSGISNTSRELEKLKKTVKEQTDKSDKSNKTNETVDPASTRGKFPAKKEDR